MDRDAVIAACVAARQQFLLAPGHEPWLEGVERGLSHAHTNLLFLIEGHPGRTVGDVARQLGKPVRYVLALAPLLVDEQLLEVEWDRAHPARSRLHLCPAGHALLAPLTAQRAAQSTYQRVLCALPDEFLVQERRLWEVKLAALEQLGRTGAARAARPGGD